MLLHVLRHVEAHHCSFVVEQKFSERPSRLSFADARWPQEDKRANWTIWILQARAGAPHRIRHRFKRFLLANHSLAQAIFHGQKFLHFAFEHF